MNLKETDVFPRFVLFFQFNLISRRNNESSVHWILQLVVVKQQIHRVSRFSDLFSISRQFEFYELRHIQNWNWIIKIDNCKIELSSGNLAADQTQLKSTWRTNIWFARFLILLAFLLFLKFIFCVNIFVIMKRCFVTLRLVSDLFSKYQRQGGASVFFRKITDLPCQFFCLTVFRWKIVINFWLSEVARVPPKILFGFWAQSKTYKSGHGWKYTRGSSGQIFSGSSSGICSFNNSRYLTQKFTNFQKTESAKKKQFARLSQ